MNTSTHPERIEAAAQAIALRTREITALREQLAIIEAHHTLDVQSTTNEQGKALYSNEEARRAAQTLRLADDESYRQAIPSNNEKVRRDCRCLHAPGRTTNYVEPQHRSRKSQDEQRERPTTRSVSKQQLANLESGAKPHATG